MKANEILAIGNEIFSTNERKSIYKKKSLQNVKPTKKKESANEVAQKVGCVHSRIYCKQ